ncbi:hypothetical protein [Kangiella sp.]|uniref:hypothetical protein n=1 Tax=Kangiella sp. TaxID=1920245 RepID=UPI0019AFED31|nr:hypothetical protein [Kangiella sp.]MBD3652354.1 hypothetical protein [Kangiella sp.]
MKSITTVLLMALTLLVTGCMKPMTLNERMEQIPPEHHTNYHINHPKNKFARAIAKNTADNFEFSAEDSGPDVIMGTAYASPNTSLAKVIIADLLFSRQVQSELALPIATFHTYSDLSAPETFNNILSEQWFSNLLNQKGCAISGYYNDNNYRIASTFHAENQLLYREFKCEAPGLSKAYWLSLTVFYSESGSETIVNISEKEIGSRHLVIEPLMRYETLETFIDEFPDSWLKIGYGFADTKDGPEWLAKVIKDGKTAYLEVPVMPGSNHESEIKRYKEEYL